MDKFQCVPALNLYNRVFDYVPPMVLKWSTSNEQFEVEGKTHWGYWQWCFNTFIVAGVIGFGSCVDVIANKEEAGGSMVVIACGFASLSFLFWVCAAVLIWKVDEIVLGIVYLKNILKHLGQMRVIWNKKFRSGTTSHITAYGIKLAVLTLATIPFTLPALCLWVGLDPFAYTFPKYMSGSWVCGSTLNITCVSVIRGISFVIRVLCAFICVTEACRFFAVLFCMLIYTLELVVRCIEVLSHTHLKFGCVNDSLSFCKWYTALRIAHKVLYSPLCSLFALILGDGFFIILICNIATIRAYEILPIEVYWLMPTVSMLFSFFVAFALPFAVKVYKSSEEMVHTRKVIIGCHRSLANATKRKLDKRETFAVKPIVISCGGFFDLERGAETTYFDLVFARTVDGLLVPM